MVINTATKTLVKPHIVTYAYLFEPLHSGPAFVDGVDLFRPLREHEGESLSSRGSAKIGYDVAFLDIQGHHRQNRGGVEDVIAEAIELGWEEGSWKQKMERNNKWIETRSTSVGKE